MAGDDRPGFRRIADHLAGRIAVREWAVGDKLPSKRVLAAEYETAYTTMARALDDLARDGMVQPVQREGTYVTGTVRKARKSDHDLLIELAERLDRIEKHLGLG